MAFGFSASKAVFLGAEECFGCQPSSQPHHEMRIGAEDGVRREPEGGGRGAGEAAQRGAERLPQGALHAA